MKRILASSILVFMLGTALFLPATALAGVVKFDFSVKNPDGSETIVEVSSRTNKQGNVTVCNYYDDESGAFLGQFQGSTPSGTSDPVEAETLCKEHIPSAPG